MRGRASRPLVRRKYTRTLPQTKLVGVFPELPGACRRGEKRLVLALLGVFLVGLLLTGCSKRKDGEIVDYSDAVYEVCIHGHVYYKSYERLAIKLENDGTPSLCRVEGR